MGKKSQPAPPPPPNPADIIRAEADVNRIDQFLPGGTSLTFAGPNRREATLELGPDIQRLFDAQVGLDTSLLNLGGRALGPGGISDLIGDPLSTEGLPGLPTDFDAFRDEQEQAFFERSRGLLEEQFGRDEERLRQTLANQGLQSGGEAFGTEFGIFNQRRGETFENLARDAVLFGGAEASRALADQAGIRNTLFGEAGATRANQFNELASLLGLQQVQQPGLQNFFGPGSVNALDAHALRQQQLQNNFGTQSRAASAAKGAGADLAGKIAAGFISDVALKEDIELVGKYGDHNWYIWKWKDNELGHEGHGMGVIAQEVPHASFMRDGYLHVDYGRLING